MRRREGSSKKKSPIPNDRATNLAHRERIRWLVPEVVGWPFELYAGFTDSPSVVPILGQHGFFSLFEVKFNLSKEEIELKPIKR
jgi:hypothetical protein